MLLQIEHKDDTLQDMMELAKASGGGGLRPTQVAELSNSILRSNIFSCCGCISSFFGTAELGNGAGRSKGAHQALRRQTSAHRGHVPIQFDLRWYMQNS
ncbi:hypothetical protein PF010_g7011 [Phytophthora fragariae]|uniref:Uncharacterized protein n=2 Tax=Phytophthora fragariae TaxID=53985 RepID=A0A6A3TGN1_9STRA|nr:hypothetical protein PF003_g34453 [Phytophthora fragariae]KAE8916441.1 hypothetical protein PF009_g33236 [Phytophthora fragariae]KAE8937743.1 hypothetical protein PF009_g12367 [Phytophthora fragariae]KAE9009875.1 hypothetical protein PF011_g10070 [Phytophthora fragariae]KAE9121676.1 hypothetical protein PF010_g7011 [Phytophthora fragariae]